jgi:hypothetical protein
VTAISPHLLDAIVNATSGDEAAKDLYRRWRAVLPELEERAQRIREEVRTAPCSCERAAEPLLWGRCPRCWGWVGTAEEAA